MTRVFKAKRKPRTVTKAVKRYVKNANRRQGELKYLTQAGTYLPSYASGVASTPLYNMPEGTGENERIGLKIRPTSFNMRFTAYRGLTDCFLRLVVFRSTDNTVGPVNNSFVLNDLGTSGTSNYINEPRKMVKAGRLFQILYDRTWLLDDAKQNGIKKDINIKTSGSPVHYTNPAITNTRKGEIYWFFMTDTSIANQPSIRYITKASYRDV